MKTNFFRYFYAELLSSSPRLFRAAVISLGIVIFFFMIHILSCLESKEYTDFSQVYYPITQWFAMMVSYIFICKSFVQFQRPLTTSFALMLPVSKGHKFTAILLINLVVLPALLWAVVLGSNLLISLLTTGDLSFLDTKIFAGTAEIMFNEEVVEHYSGEWLSLYAMGLLNIIWGYVFCFLIALLFRRAQFGWAMLITVTLLIMAAFATFPIAKYVIHQASDMTFTDRTEYIRQISINGINYYNIFTALCIILSLLWSWRRFKTLKIKR